MTAGAGESTPTEVRSLGYLLLGVISARTGVDLISRGVPFLPVLESFGTDYEWGRALSGAYFAGALLALTGRFFRPGCAIAGAALVGKVLGNMGSYSNGRLFDGLLLLLVGLCATPRGVTILRAQCILLYVGSSLSKCLDPDWWNGRFLTALFEHHLRADTLALLAPWAWLFGIVSMVMEAMIGGFLAIPGTRNYGVALVALFHTTMLILLNEDFATFYYAVALSATLLFIRIPEIRSLATPLSTLAGHSVLSQVRLASRERGKALVEFKDATLTGSSAWLFLLLGHLPFLAMLLMTAAYCGRIGLSGVRNWILGLTVFAATTLALSTTLRSRVARPRGSE